MESVSAVSIASQAPAIQPVPDVLKDNDNKAAKAMQPAEPKVEKQKQESASEPKPKPKQDTLLDSNVEEAPVPQLDSRFSLKFETDRELNIIVAKIVDKKTGDTVSQIPPEQMFKTMKYLRDNPGSLLDRQA
ncbi:MAG: flagellar protein FlaG [Nitrospirae bacterium]|nr:flagellar protein FlaG [Nitrospirota bacterium]